MEKAGRSIADKLKTIPSWIQTLLQIGGLIFALGVMYNDVQTLKLRVNKYEATQVQQIRMEGQIGILQDQIREGKDTQKQTYDAVTKLADAVNNLSVSVATLQTKLEYNKKAR